MKLIISAIALFVIACLSLCLFSGCTSPLSVELENEVDPILANPVIAFTGRVRFGGVPVKGAVVDLEIVEYFLNKVYGMSSRRTYLQRQTLTDKNGKYRIEVERRDGPLFALKSGPVRFEHERDDYYASIIPEKTFPQFWNQVTISVDAGWRQESKYVRFKTESITKIEFEKRWRLPRIDSHNPNTIRKLPVVGKEVRTDFMWEEDD